MKKTILFTILTALTLGSFGPAHAARMPVDTVAPLAFASTGTLEGKLNINEADAKQWELLPGIGPSTADKLVAYQKKHGFKDVLHVMRVKGIGRKTFDRIKPYLTLEGNTTLHKSK